MSDFFLQGYCTGCKRIYKSGGSIKQHMIYTGLKLIDQIEYKGILTDRLNSRVLSDSFDSDIDQGIFLFYFTLP